MISRRILEDIFASLPAILITRLSVSADEAIAMADDCIIDDEKSEVIWVYVSIPGKDILSNYRLGFAGFAGCSRERNLTIQKLRRQAIGSSLQWQVVQ